MAMTATAFDSAIHSVVAFCMAAGAHQVGQAFDANIPAFSLGQLWLLFISAFGWAILKYLDAHPLAALLPVDDDALSRLNRALEDSIKPKGGGGNATGSRPAEPTAAPALSPAPPQCPQ